MLNSSFEEGLKHWNSWTPDGQAPVHQATEEQQAGDTAATGKKKLAHWSDVPYQQLSYQTIEGLPDGTYKLTGKVRSGGGQQTLLLGAQNFDNTVSDEQKSGQLNGAVYDQWRTFQVDGIVVKGGKAIIFVYSVASEQQWATFDDISFTRVK